LDGNKYIYITVLAVALREARLFHPRPCASFIFQLSSKLPFVFAALAANVPSMPIEAAGAFHFTCAGWDRDNSEDPETVWDSDELTDLIHLWID
jgi:hypothetical protein